MKGNWIPMKIRFETGEIEINTPQDAVDLLRDWPETKGYLHERALFWCQDAARGHASVAVAQLAFRGAIGEIGMFPVWHKPHRVGKVIAAE